jgi:ATP-dependent Lon protease
MWQMRALALEPDLRKIQTFFVYFCHSLSIFVYLIKFIAYIYRLKVKIFSTMPMPLVIRDFYLILYAMKERYILPLRDLVLQPGLTVPVYLDMPVSVAAIDAAAKSDKEIILAPQRVWNYPTKAEELFERGTRAHIIQVLRMPDESVHCMVKTMAPVDLSDIRVENGLFKCNAADIEQTDDSDSEYVKVLRDKVAEGMRSIAKQKKINVEKLRPIIQSYAIGAFIDAVVQMAGIEAPDALKILGMRTYSEKLLTLLEHIGVIAEMVKIDESISRRVNSQMDSGRREAYLHEKMRALKKEMGDDVEELDEEILKKRILDAKMPKDAEEKALSEWKRLCAVPPMSSESSVIRTYLDELVSMPWNKSDKSEIDLEKSREILNSQHYGMTAAKERILEHIAVMKKTGGTGGSILCLVGAPGVGKTSLGRSVAEALGRKYHRMSLGGISDEAHFRGHRKTYIGSQPGRIMDALKRAGTNNLVVVLDEIDKMGRDYRVDPEAALLEILDPEQNKSFRDHYLEVDFDLSKVIFIATSNSMNLSPALKDRMEVIEILPYSEEEKVQIATNHLVARAAADTGFDPKDVSFSEESLRHIINKYTAESGVRELRREITAVLRRALLKGMDKVELSPTEIDELLSARGKAVSSKRIGFGVRM